MTLIADVFPEISTPKCMVRLMSKKPCFRGPLDIQHGKSVETMFQSEWQHLYKNLSVTLRVVALEKVSFINRQNPQSVCYHIDCR